MSAADELKHASWDQGVIQDAVKQFLGAAVPQKTTKTQCGRRVSMSRIDDDDPTCPVCKQEIADQRRILEDLQKIFFEGGTE